MLTCFAVSLLLAVAGIAGKSGVNLLLTSPIPHHPHPRNTVGKTELSFRIVHPSASSWEETAIPYLGCFTSLKCEGRIWRKEVIEKRDLYVSEHWRELPEKGWEGW